MEGANRIQLEKNVFERNGWAMKIQASCMDVTVYKNNFLSNTFDVGTNSSAPTVKDGIVVVKKTAVLPDGFVI